MNNRHLPEPETPPYQHLHLHTLHPAPQQHDAFHAGYQVPPAHLPPTSPRQVFTSTALAVNHPTTTMRSVSQHLGPIAGHPPSFYADDSSIPFDDATRHNRMKPAGPGQAFPNNYMLGNTQAWNYNAAAAGAATINGPMTDSGRLRSANRPRLPIPTDWGQHDPNMLTTQMLPTTQSYSHQPMLNHHRLGLANGLVANDCFPYQSTTTYSARPNRAFDETKKDMAAEQLIPTAIVIKNIPFNIRKEVLNAIMIEMNLPQPYAFNYHFDSGIFRGLAFANFSSADDTALVIEKMNGLEVEGRKLRVEYKKMLPEHERERIEREKREKRGQLEEQHRPIALTGTLRNQSSMHSLSSAQTATAGRRSSPLRDIDLNNPDTLSFYTELTLFRNDPSREILIFPSTISPDQRRTVHILAHNMGLDHRSVGTGIDRQLHVIKDRAAGRTSPNIQHTALLPPGVSSDAHRRGLSRAATIDFAESRIGTSTNYNAIGRQGPMLELPSSPDGPASGLNGLRGVKSFADLRSYTPSPSPSLSGCPPPTGVNGANVARFGDYGTCLPSNGVLTTPTTPSGTLNTPSTAQTSDHSILLPNMTSLSLTGFEPPCNLAQPRTRDAPGAIGSQRPGVNGSAPRTAQAPERQPHGPDWESSTAGFTSQRNNGHAQHGSDSSDNSCPPF